MDAGGEVRDAYSSIFFAVNERHLHRSIRSVRSDV